MASRASSRPLEKLHAEKLHAEKLHTEKLHTEILHTMQQRHSQPWPRCSTSTKWLGAKGKGKR